ncbi:hypothetical protein G6F70_001335 [Rhizopus microsporus]|nr:hypothetical protein G6F71_001777 [Rhizopus microsporus]KAG1203468.1 hypothetical protein G6F70_001335 [Rhizopus microsporus]KAG1215101.1 hypothetical protein G6F69_001298 [Rhizopus microsporus]KAG1237504.1 hypothetical protein G6F67_001182 [Rhizopus microsporus]KAG1267128.1 hypothetical protein G6F68_002195 [Rhizopus microsporus]
MSDIFSLKKQLIVYGAHHNNKVNVAIHMVFVPTILWTVYYVILDPIAATLYTPILLYMCHSATNYYKTNPNANKIAIVIHIISWILQLLGHGLAEKRSPKFLDNVVQAFVSAPYFVFFEVLFMLGYRPKLYKEVMYEVNKDIATFRARQKRRDVPIRK